MRCRRRFSSLMEGSGFRGLDYSPENEFNLSDRSLEALPTGSRFRGLDCSPGSECNPSDRSLEALTTMASVLDCPDPMLSEEFADESSTPDNPGIFAYPLVKPRIGHEFQVQIQAFITEFDNLQMMTGRDVSSSHCLGLPIPVIWVHNEAPENQDDRVKSCGLGNEVVSMVVNSGEIIRPTRHNHKNIDKFCFDSSILAPGSVGQTWSKIEVESFVLGLYIFNKDFNKVRRFIECREMGHILEFYYSNFYGSVMYHRWLNFRKMGTKRCPAGRKIFRGRRQKKLVSRLLPQVSKESQVILSEVSWKYSEGRISLEEYVSTMKSAVGITALIAAIGIGDKETDLTHLVTNSPKTDKVFACTTILRQESFCSSTFEEIVKLLKGDRRLSKARSNNLFWDAVWPRLLAQGWHSEKPDRKSWFIEGPHFVFIIPGIQEFSRELVKGEHFFDSICDILGKVASDPKVLLLEDEKFRLSYSTNSTERSNEAEAGKDSILARKRKGYQKAKGSTCKAAASKSTIKDPDIINEERSAKKRGKVCLNSSKSSIMRETDEIFSELTHVCTNASKDANASTHHREKCDLVKMKSTTRSEDAENIHDNHYESNTSSSTAKSQRKSRHHFDQMTEVANESCSNYSMKWRRMTRCATLETNVSSENFSVDSEQKHEDDTLTSNFEASANDLVSQMGPSPDQVICISSSDEGSSRTRPQPRLWLDLNVALVPQDLGSGGSLSTESPLNANNTPSCLNSVDDELIENQTDDEMTSDVTWTVGKSNVSTSKRRSSRTRPLTSKALEAISKGFIDVKKNCKRKN